MSGLKNIENDQESTRRERTIIAAKKARRVVAEKTRPIVETAIFYVVLALAAIGLMTLVVLGKMYIDGDFSHKELSSFSSDDVECAEGMRPTSPSADQNANVNPDVAYEVETLAWNKSEYSSVTCVTPEEYDAYAETAKANIQQRETNQANAAERETADANALEAEALGMINSGFSADDVIALLVNRTCYYETVNSVLPSRAAELYESVWFYSPLSNAQASLYDTLNEMNCPGAYAFEIPEEVSVDNNFDNPEYPNNTILVPPTTEEAHP